MKKHYAYFMQLVLLTLFTGISYGQVNTNTPGSYTTNVPANAVSATVQIWGAGGAGGGSTVDGAEGAGGGGGGFSTRTFLVTGGDIINYTVGAGGNGSTGNGTAGGKTTLTHTPGANMTANGGSGGIGNNNEKTTGIGIGGTAAGGTTNTSGQNGGPGFYNNSSPQGSTGGNGGNGGNAPGTGGQGQTNANGTQPGGGGGGGEYANTGSNRNRSGGNGANGRVVITYLIQPNPTITSFTPLTACVGASVVIRGTNFTGATSVEFNGVPTSSYTVNSSTQITAVIPPSATTGRIKVTTPVGSVESSNITIQNPVVAAGTISGTATVCQGATNVLFSVPAITNATSYTWFLPFGATIASGNGSRSIRVNFSSMATSGNISVAGTNSCGSGTASSNFPIVVNVPSTAPTSISGTTTVCSTNPSTTLTVNGGSLGTGAVAEWFTGSCGGTSAGSGNSIEVLPLATTTYYVRYKGDCNTTSCVSLTVNVENSVTGGVISGSDTVCQGDKNVTYTLSGMTNQTSYLWTVPDGATYTGQLTNTIIVDYTNATSGSDTVTVTGTNSCGSETITLPITINAAPRINLTSAAATENQTLCINSGLTAITYAITGGTTGATVTALPAGLDGSFSGGVFTITGTPTVAGSFNYTVTTTGGLCGVTSTSGTIIIEAAPTLVLAPGSNDSQTSCIQTAITNINYNVGGAATNATVAGLPAGVTGSYAAGVFTISGTPTVSGTFNYTVTTTGGTCAPITATGTLNIDPLPSIFLFSGSNVANQIICVNTVLTSIPYTIGGSATGAEISSGTLPNGVTGSYDPGTKRFIISGTPSEVGIFNFTVITTGGSCTGVSLSGSIQVDALPTLALSSAPDEKLCINNAIQNITYNVGGGATGADVSGLPAGVSGSYNSNNKVFTISGTPTATGVFPYTVTTEGTCTAVTRTGTITVDPDANASVIITSNLNEVCIGGDITFTAAPVNGGDAPLYQWYLDDTLTETNYTGTFTPFNALLTAGNHTVYVDMQSSLSDCNNKNQSDPMTVTIHPTPILTAPTQVCMGSMGTLSADITGTWISNNNSIATVTSGGVITPIASNLGTVTFTFTSTNGCTNTTKAVKINALPVIGNLPTNNDICVNETHPLSPSTGGTWTSSNPAIASITNAGLITGVASGSGVTFIYTNTATGCSSVASVPITVLAIPAITNVTQSENSVCSLEPTILTANVIGDGTNKRTLVNYNFNSGNNNTNYTNINGQAIAGITTNMTGLASTKNIPFNRLSTGGTNTTASAFTTNTTPTNSNGALRQTDDRESNSSSPKDDGYWYFNLTSSTSANVLRDYQNFNVYFQAKRDAALGNDKFIQVEYRINGTGTWTVLSTLNINGDTNWREFNQPLPGNINNPTSLHFRLYVNDGSTGTNNNNAREPHILLDNFQVQGSTSNSAFNYAWTADTGANGGLPTGNLNNNRITVNPNVTTTYTVTATNSVGCSATETVTVGVFQIPDFRIVPDYCPDYPNSNSVQLTAVGNGFDNYEWSTGENTQTIYIDIAGTYQVIGTTTDGCTVSATINIAEELVVDGSFTNFDPANPSFFTEYIQNQGYYNGTNGGSGTSGLYAEGRYAVNTSAYGLNGGPLGYHPRFFGRDHTNNTIGSRNFLMVNGSTDLYNPPGPEGPRQRIIWQQTVTVEPETHYYFSAYGMNLNPDSPARLQFEVNGVKVGTIAELNVAPKPTSESMVNLDNWVRFYSNPTWNSGSATTAVIRIINLNTAPGGNDFGLDDISFATLSTFIRLNSADGTDNQIMCQNTPIQDITYEVGGGLSAPTVQNLPPGLNTTYDGLIFRISGTPTETGTFNYTINTNASCGNKVAEGKIVVELAPLVTITTPSAIICQSERTIQLSATLSGSATGGTWSVVDGGNLTTSPGLIAEAEYTITTPGLVTFTFTSNDPGSSCGPAVKTVDFEISPYHVAVAGIAPEDETIENCSHTLVTLAANNVVGQWSVTSSTPSNASYSFGNVNEYNSTFTGESGTNYTLTWTAINTGACENTTAEIEVNIPDCGTDLVFEGSGEYIDFGDNFNLSGSFSIEAWVKPENFTGTKTIISKRNGSSLASGYDLSLIAGRVHFRFNDKDIFVNQQLSKSKWFHVAVTHIGSSYRIYIDGFEMLTATSGVAPSPNTNKALIGAMAGTGNSPTHYFNGGIDEVRIWKTGLSVAQIREMMNQEIKQNGDYVMGEVIPMDISGGLKWNDLVGYYQMNTGDQTSVSAGNIQNISDASIPGKLNGMTDIQKETAPIPYLSVADSNWDIEATWSTELAQQIPNSRVETVLPGSEQTWNIVRTKSNVTANRSTTNLPPNITVMGLLVDANKELTITGPGTNQDETNIGSGLWVTHYLKIDGKIDLVGESQLVQKRLTPTEIGESYFDSNSTGVIERDQQGTGNAFNYNYWSSPVSASNAIVTASNESSNTYTLLDVLRAGTQTIDDPYSSATITWINGHTPNPVSNVSNNDVELTRRWLYTYYGATNTYSVWNLINESSPIKLGLGYSMKGSGTANANQNYVFVGKPNNGTISNPIVGGSSILIGNPYPSAIDADEFIKNNGPNILNSNASILKDGALSFWEQYSANNTHVLRDYVGGYATYNLIGGQVAATPPPTIDGYVISNGGPGTRKPQRYIPVGQGFFVTSSTTGGTIIFKNSQRVFQRESPTTSIFFRASDNNSEDPQKRNTDFDENDIQRVRLTFKTPEGAIRPLLLGFTPDDAATDGIDYGYDAYNNDDFPSDLSFAIEGKKFVIQGVGAFDISKKYSLDMTLKIKGPIEIALSELENFEEPIDVYIHDALLDTYTRINDVNFQLQLEKGNYTGRFSLVFKPDSTLSTIDKDFKEIQVKYLQKTDEIYVKTPASIEVRQVYLINMAGQAVKSWNMTNMNFGQEFKIPVKNISEGNYILKVETSTNSYNKKMVIKFK